MTVTTKEALSYARQWIERARSAIKQSSGKPCAHCHSMPRLDREEYLLNLQLIALGDKCEKLALSEFGQRPTRRVPITRERGLDVSTRTSDPAR